MHMRPAAKFDPDRVSGVRTASPEVRILSQYYPPDIAATGELLADLATELSRRGWSVGVLTAQPSYALAERAPALESRNGVQVRRLFSPTWRKNSWAGRIGNALFFSLSALLACMFSRGPRLNIIVSNPPFLPLLGVLCKALRGEPFIYVVHDVYPDVAIRLGRLRQSSWVCRFLARATLCALQSADRVVVLDAAMQHVVASRLKRGHNKVTVISNWADGEWIRPLPRQENQFARQYGLTEKFVVLYSGNLGLAHNLELLIFAAQALRECSELQFVFIGDGGKRAALERMTRAWSLSNVLFLPYQPRDMLPYSLTCADLSVVTLEQGTSGLISPCKLYTALAAGSPILAVAEEESPLSRLILEKQCGFHVSPGDLPAAVAAIRCAQENPAKLAEMARRSRLCFENHFRKDLCLSQYALLIEALAGRPQKPRARAAAGGAQA